MTQKSANSNIILHYCHVIHLDKKNFKIFKIEGSQIVMYVA